MAYNLKYPPDDDGKKSDWNAASYKMKRLHDILSEINIIDDNLEAWNPLRQTYNYKVKFHRCENLYQEVESKLTKDERKDVEKLRKTIENFMYTNPVHTNVRQKIYPYGMETKTNKDNLRVLTNWLSKYETSCRKLVDTHGMDTSYKDSEEGL